VGQVVPATGRALSAAPFVAYGDAVDWVAFYRAAAKPRGRLGISLTDVGLTAVVIGAVELSVFTGGGPGAAPLNAKTYLFGAILALPVLVRRRWPLGALLACSTLLLLYYSLDRRNVSPAPLLSLPLYDAAVSGALVWAIVIPTFYMSVGLFVVGASTHQGLITLIAEFAPQIALLGLAIMLGEVVRSRRALTAETAERLRAAQEEREAEAGRRVAEERLRIARDLHDTVAHSMATITVQAGSALHILGEKDDSLRAALTAIRETSKEALREMRVTLGQLRRGGRPGEGEPGGGEPGTDGLTGLDRLPALRDAVTAAGAPVTVEIEGEQRALPGPVDQVAYRILQESLTNVLRHAGPSARATVRLCYQPTALAIQVTDDGPPLAAAPGLPEPGRPGNGGHGLTGMAERAAAVGGRFTAGPRAGGGFEVSASLPAGPGLPAIGGTE
jgi:signal transduction histidine kinase